MTHLLLKVTGIIILWLILCGMTAWGTMAIFFSYLPDPAKWLLSVLFPLIQLTVLILLKPKGLAYAIFLALFALVLWGYFSMKPSNHREWQADVALVPYAHIEGDRVTVYNIRNCDYKSETDYTARYYNRTLMSQNWISSTCTW